MHQAAARAGWRCPSCQADLDLLVDYVSHLQGGLERAENLTCAGELGQACGPTWTCWRSTRQRDGRGQVSQVATAVRQFDFVTPG